MVGGLPAAHRIACVTEDIDAHRFASVTEAIAAECLECGLLCGHGIACGTETLAVKCGWTMTEVARCRVGGGSVAVCHEGSAGVCGHCGVVTVVVAG